MRNPTRRRWPIFKDTSRVNYIRLAVAWRTLFSVKKARKLQIHGTVTTLWEPTPGGPECDTPQFWKTPRGEFPTFLWGHIVIRRVDHQHRKAMYLSHTNIMNLWHESLSHTFTQYECTRMSLYPLSLTPLSSINLYIYLSRDFVWSTPPVFLVSEKYFNFIRIRKSRSEGNNVTLQLWWGKDVKNHSVCTV